MLNTGTTRRGRSDFSIRCKRKLDAETAWCIPPGFSKRYATPASPFLTGLGAIGGPRWPCGVRGLTDGPQQRHQISDRPNGAPTLPRPALHLKQLHRMHHPTASVQAPARAVLPSNPAPGSPYASPTYAAPIQTGTGSPRPGHHSAGVRLCKIRICQFWGWRNAGFEPSYIAPSSAAPRLPKRCPRLSDGF